jgi:uncharacterized protein YndB with AHSA1/START domain
MIDADDAGAVVDGEAFTVSRTLHIPSPRSEVWDAVSRPERIAAWFSDTAALDEVAVGTTGTLGWAEWGEYTIAVTAVVPGSVLEYRWARDAGAPLRDDNSTAVRFTLADAPDGTILTLVESGFERLSGDDESRRAYMSQNREGWDMELGDLLEHLGSS